MTMPIRRTTARLAFTGAMALGSAGLLAGTALAQYPPDITINVVTPGANIEIEGSDWGPRTEVTITKVDREGNAASDAGGSTTTQSAAQTTTVEVAEDGTFEAPVTVPEDAEPGSEVEYVISGVDAQGNERSEERVLEVQLTSAEQDAESDDAELAAPLPADDGNGTTLVLVSAAGVAAVAGGAAFARRRSTVGS